MKKIFTIILLSLTLLLVGCGAEPISTETREVEVVVVDTYHRSMWLQPIRVGKVTSFITHPEVNRIEVSYEGGTYSIDDSHVYDEFHDDIGETVIGVLEVRIYEDGTIKQRIVDLKE